MSSHMTLEVIVLGTGGKVETAGRHGISFSSFRASLRPNLCKFRKLVHIPPGHLSPFRSQWWGLVRTFARGNSSRSGQSRSFFNFSLKNMLIQIALDISVKNIFNTYALERYAWFSLSHFSTPQYFLYPSKKLLPAIVISSHMEEKLSRYRLKSLKKKTLFLCVNG